MAEWFASTLPQFELRLRRGSWFKRNLRLLPSPTRPLESANEGSSPQRKDALTPAKAKRVSFPQPQQQLKVAHPTPERQIVESLQRVLSEVDSMALPGGQLGCEFLDALKLVERISEKVFAKARQLLQREPSAIPNWRVNEVPMRTLSKNTLKVFIASAHADSSLTAEEFLTYCTTNLGRDSQAPG